MKQRVIALGYFDGVHIGHGALLKKTREIANRLGLSASALTFDTHPDELVRGDRICLLGTVAERQWLMQTIYGMDEMIVLHFDYETMRQPWQEFVEKTLIETYHAAHVVCGYDFRFGAKGEGNAHKLAELCAQHGVGCDCVAQVQLDGVTVSSTVIRSFLEQGELEKAVKFYGHPHLISGTVVDGRKLGRTIGIPTANLAMAEGVIVPKFGVYAAKVYFDGAEHIAVVNIGKRPTVNGHSVTVEPWILDFEGDLYGKNLHLELYAYLREEKKFESLDELKLEIQKNAEQTKAYFNM